MKSSSIMLAGGEGRAGPGLLAVHSAALGAWVVMAGAPCPGALLSGRSGTRSDGLRLRGPHLNIACAHALRQAGKQALLQRPPTAEAPLPPAAARPFRAALTALHAVPACPELSSVAGRVVRAPQAKSCWSRQRAQPLPRLLPGSPGAPKLVITHDCADILLPVAVHGSRTKCLSTRCLGLRGWATGVRTSSVDTRARQQQGCESRGQLYGSLFTCMLSDLVAGVGSGAVMTSTLHGPSTVPALVLALPFVLPSVQRSCGR